ncbi:MAG TPA: S9 family peptidase [Chloroflexota bacterium]
MPQAAPHGGWRSPISAADIASSAVPLSAPELVGRDVYWLEGKPLEGGRTVVVRLAADGNRQELTPAPYNVRTRVHEYGGGAYLVSGETLFFSNFADQRLYRQDAGTAGRPITPEPPVAAGVRFADAQATPDGRWLICVRERHTAAEGAEAINELAVLAADGSAEGRTIASGHDFYSSPRISADGRRLAWLSWDHPNMPWDGTELWAADLASDGSLSNQRRVAGGAEESIFQPEWSPFASEPDTLYFVSDRTRWWNLYRQAATATRAEPLAPTEAEFGTPQWVFGMSTYAFLEDGRLACVMSQNGFDHIAFVRPGSGQGVEIADLPYTAISRRIRASGNTLVFVAATPTEAAAVVRMDASTRTCEVLRRGLEAPPDSSFVSRPRAIAFPTDDGRATAYAIYYPPTNPDFVGTPGALPPLIVESHGGPTSMTPAQFDMGIQYWTSRGFGVVDVNYGGSSGYGRAYRDRLRGQWGIVDTQDCISAARFLAASGEVDGRRLAIRGGSAGGYTTLCALVFHDDFAAGASYYGVADCEALATDTHKFESRYLDGLIGPYPAARDVYYARSPIHFADKLACPVILFQGLEDRVVPPAQAEMMVAALRAKHLPVAYLAFAGEQHGFRKAETIQRTLEAELYFYSRVFKFPLADAVEPVEIDNLT